MTNPTPQSLPNFTIEGFRRVRYGTKAAEFTLLFETPHLEVDGELFIPGNKPPSVSPASVQDARSKRYRQTVRWSPELRASILAEALRVHAAMVDGDSVDLLTDVEVIITT